MKFQKKDESLLAESVTKAACENLRTIQEDVKNANLFCMNRRKSSASTSLVRGFNEVRCCAKVCAARREFRGPLASDLPSPMKANQDAGLKTPALHSNLRQGQMMDG
jgi:hypothetical protein